MFAGLDEVLDHGWRTAQRGHRRGDLIQGRGAAGIGGQPDAARGDRGERVVPAGQLMRPTVGIGRSEQCGAVGGRSSCR